MKKISEALNDLARSKFRSGFRLNSEDVKYINKLGFAKIESQARDFALKRLSPKNPKNDGRPNAI